MKAIPVLIRLPDLSEPASREKAPEVADEQAEPVDMPIADAESAVQLPVSDDPGEQAPDESPRLDSEEPDIGPPEEKPNTIEDATPSVVTVPRPVMQLAGVLALIGMLVAVYFAIVGGEARIVDEDEGGFAGEQAPVASTDQSPPTELTESIESTDIALAPPLENDQQQELIINPPVTDPGSTFLEPESTLESDATADASTTDPTQSETFDPPLEEEADSSSGSDFWRKADRLDGIGVDLNDGQDELHKTDALTQPEHRSDIVHGLTGQSQRELPNQTLDIVSDGYPLTDPSKYQYPEDYHTMFPVSSEANNSQEATLRRPSERSRNDQYPGTARLRSPIEAPPIHR